MHLVVTGTAQQTLSRASLQDSSEMDLYSGRTCVPSSALQLIYQLSILFVINNNETMDAAFIKSFLHDHSKELYR